MHFEEKQGLKIWWLYLITALGILPALSVLIFSNSGPSLAELRQMYFAPFLAILLPFLIIYLIQIAKLITIINQDGIFYRYFPLVPKTKKIEWLDINDAYIRKYDALSEYGGWGVKTRLWFKFRDKAFILNNGNEGLQIELKNGRKILFSTNKIEELTAFLLNLKTRHNIQAIK